ncbi:MAG: methionine--tRNA ligase [Candidatus Marsarchaeota archaeon]|jgi:methionyl-tRNA synthetase|nr:methionine--tRNA ligase [Candidatus Marsarchaeota archaeon]MCL5418752.1 methionine--tRNA ligase [Candidatus Marsarchaeota archaeon]
MARYIITSALPYVEGVPHLGNFVGSVLPADIFYKFMLLKREDAIFICGSDQHGTPIELQALKKGVEPSELADKLHHEVKEVLEKFECTFTMYGNTNSKENELTVDEIFEALIKNKYIIETQSELAYCNTDQRFISDRFIEGTCPYCGYDQARGDQCDHCGHLLTPKELIKPHCVICNGTNIVFKETRNLALDLAALQGKIEAFINGNKDNNWSKIAVTHSLGYIKRGLEPREITRDLKFGFKVPYKGFEDKVFYVWFDAVIGYIGITRSWSDAWERYWKDSETILIQFMGKDNIEFHTLMWPGILIGSGLGFVLPHTIIAYEYLLSKGIKFSKSRGIGLNLESAIEIAHPDYWRFALAMLLPETSDTDFSVERLIEIIDNDMNNNIGNFAHRVLSLAKSIEAKRPETLTGASADLVKKVNSLISAYEEHFEKVQIREALHDVLEIAALGNSYISATEPWKYGNANGSKELNEIVYTALDVVYRMAMLLYPFVPASSARLLEMFEYAGEPSLERAKEGIAGSVHINKELVKPIFSKLSEEQIRKLYSLK